MAHERDGASGIGERFQCFMQALVGEQYTLLQEWVKMMYTYLLLLLFTSHHDLRRPTRLSLICHVEGNTLQCPVKEYGRC